MTRAEICALLIAAGIEPHPGPAPQPGQAFVKALSCFPDPTASVPDGLLGWQPTPFSSHYSSLLPSSVQWGTGTYTQADQIPADLLEEYGLPESCKKSKQLYPSTTITTTSTQASPASTATQPVRIQPSPAIAAKVDDYLPPRTPLTESYLRHDPEAIFATHPDTSSQILPHQSYSKHDWGFTLGGSQYFTAEQHQRFVQMIESFRQSFAFTVDDLNKGYQGLFPPMRIEITDPDKPCRVGKRWHTPKERDVIKDKMKPLLASGIVVECPTNQFSSNCLLPPKKDADGNWTDYRLVHDYRPINARSVLMPHRPPRMEELFMRACSKKIHTKLDLRMGFMQCHIDPRDQPKSAFHYENGLMMYTRVAFGLRSSPAYFQQMVDFEIREAGLEDCCMAYIDDILCSSDTAEEHIEHVRRLLQRLKDSNLLAHPEKSIFGTDQVEYLGHNVSYASGLTPHAARVAAIQALPNPANVSELRHVLGFISYYR